MKKRKKIVSGVVIASYLSSSPLNVMASDHKDIGTGHLPNKTYSKQNIDKNQRKGLDEVYLDGSAQTSGSGATADDPVNSFEEALDLASNGGAIYVTGEVVVHNEINLPNKLVLITHQEGQNKGKLKFENKLNLSHTLYIKNIDMEFASKDKDCVFLNGNYLEMTNVGIEGKPNIFTGSENKNISDGSGSIQISNTSTNATLGNIILGGKNGHTIETSSVSLNGVNVEGTVDGENVVDQSYLTIAGESTINKISNIRKLMIYRNVILNNKAGMDNITELYSDGVINMKNGTKIDSQYIYGEFTLDIEVPNGGSLIEGNYTESKKFTGNLKLSDKLIKAGYEVKKINTGDSICLAVFNKNTSSPTNYAPTIKNLRDVIIRKGTTIDLKKGVEGWDYEDGDITKKIVFPDVDLTTLPIGTHEVQYELTDNNQNKTVMTRTIHVIANETAKIHGAENIKIKIGEVDTFDLLKGITVTGNVDKDLKPTVEGKIEKPSPGTNKDSIITYLITDNDGNVVKVKRTITVTNQLPQISGIKDLTIKKGQELNLSEGISASDEEDGDITNKIETVGNVDLTQEGTHEITYKVEDSDGNITTVKRNVRVLSNDAPVITGIEDITIKAGDVEGFDYLKGVKVTDDHDSSLQVNVNGKIEKPKAGTTEKYVVIYTVTDNDGNTTKVERNITVTNQLPQISGVKDITIKEGQELDLLSGITASDEEDGDITDRVEIVGNVDLTQEGIHEITYKVEDSDGNITTVKRNVRVLSNDAPVITGIEDITIKVGEVEGFDYLKGVKVTDDHDSSLKINVNGKIEKPKAGTTEKYVVIYTVTDNDGNTTKVERTITVTNQLPKISGVKDITIKEGQELDLLSGITASDEEDGDITNKIEVVGNVDVNKEGIHEITYKVEDSDGNVTELKRVIKVEKENNIVNNPDKDDVDNNLDNHTDKNEIDKPTVDVPKTGDSSNIGILGSLSALGLLGVILSVFRRKK